jgi:hypothetical protein|tara:strand:+ start:871 stop:1083 length:213 start_codon:yes stop_codon:yes gene_type:complete
MTKKSKRSLTSKAIGFLNPLDSDKSTIRKIGETGLLSADLILRGLGLYKKGGRVGCGVAKRGFGKALRKK